MQVLLAQLVWMALQRMGVSRKLVIRRLIHVVERHLFGLQTGNQRRQRLPEMLDAFCFHVID